MLSILYRVWRDWEGDMCGSAQSYIPMPAFLRRYISIFSIQKQVVLYARTLLGTKVYRNVPAEVACANCVSGIMDIIDPSFFGNTTTSDRINGTYTLGDEFRRLEYMGRVKRIYEPQAGAIILCRTGTGYTGSVGHVGIIDLDGKTIMSNSSDTGIWTRNFTIYTWRKRYEHLLGFRTEYWVIIK